MDVKNLNEVPPFITKDGSEIRELLAHRNSAIRNQSLAEARLPVGGLSAASSEVLPLRRARTCVSSVSIARSPLLPWAAWVSRALPVSLPSVPVMCPSCPRSRRE